jgi:hypothetical protein
MQYGFRMTIAKTFNNLFENGFSYIFLKSSPLPHVIEKIASCAKLHHKYNVFLSFKELIEAHNIPMSGLLKDDYFLHHLLSLGFF